MNQFIAIPIMSFFLFFSCAKKQEYETVFKEAEQTNKLNDYDTSSKYIFHSTNLQGKRDVGHKIMPFQKGKGIIVKMKFEKSGLLIYMEEKDSKFKSAINETPIFTIPGSYHSYKCAENSVGECTNREEENREITWDKKAFFTPRFDEINMSSNFDPVEFANQDPCLINPKTRIIHTEIKKGVLNFEIEKEFAVHKSNSCFSSYNPRKLSDLSFKFRFFYSLIRYNDVVDSKYPKVLYPEEDQRIYGLFVTKREKLSDDFNKNVKTEYMNRWSPNHKKIVYYLSDSFNEKNSDGTLKYAIEKKATYDSIASINSTFEEINMPFRIELKEAKGIKAGDLRYSMINLVTDSAKHSVLGYGPSIKDPNTGEIIQGLVNMYYGTFRMMIPGIYRHMVEVSKKIELPKLFTLNRKKLKKRLPTSEEPSHTPKEISEMKWPEKENSQSFQKRFKVNTPNFFKDLNPVAKNAEDYWSFDRSNEMQKHKLIPNKKDELLRSFAENTAFPLEYFSVKFNGKGLIPGIEKIDGIFNKNGDGKAISLKTWKEIEDLEEKGELKDVRERIRKLIMPYAWRKTLIHEIGHNLGLRHNFKGSFDKYNFTENPEEEQAGGNSFSSIMDYGHSQLNSLPKFGPYDKAALNMAYNRKVRLYSYKIRPNAFFKGVKKFLDYPIEKGTKLKDIRIEKNEIKTNVNDDSETEVKRVYRVDRFGFCTDHHVGTDPSCNRFDEGGKYEEIVDHYIEKYKNEFNVFNYRNGRDRFGISRLRSYYWNRDHEFSKFREIFEAFEEILVEKLKKAGAISDSFTAQMQGVSIILKKCRRDVQNLRCQKLIDLNEAAHKMGLFLLDILKTPPFTCLATKKGEGKENANVHSLEEIYYDEDLEKAPKSCFDKEVLEYFDNRGEEVLGERGRYLYSLSSNSNKGFASDLSAIGIWIDKLLAMKYLVGRRVNFRALNDIDWSFLEIPGVNQKLDTFLMDLVQELPITDGIEFADFKGKKLYTPNLKYTLDEKVHGEIPRQFFGQLIWGLRLPFLNTISLNKKLIQSLNDYSVTTLANPKTEHLEYIKRFKVKKIADHVSINEKFYDISTHLDEHVFLAKKENKVAHVMAHNINTWNKIFNNKSSKDLRAFNSFKNIYLGKGNPFFAHEDRVYVQFSKLEKKIKDLKKALGPMGKKFEDLSNELKATIYNKVEELRDNPPEGELNLDESLTEFSELINYFVTLGKEASDDYSKKLADYYKYIVGSKSLRNLETSRRRFRRDLKKLKLVLDDGTNPFRPIQLYHIAIINNPTEIRLAYKELEKEDWIPSSIRRSASKEVLEMPLEEMKKIDTIISVESRSVYDNIMKRLISY